MLPDNAKLESIYPLDIHNNDKYSVTDFRSVSVLNTFLKINERIVQDFLTSKIAHHFSKYNFAHQKSFSTEMSF